MSKKTPPPDGIPANNENFDQMGDFSQASVLLYSINEIRENVRKIPCLKHPEKPIIGIHRQDLQGICTMCIDERNLSDDLYVRLGEHKRTDA